jgi:rhodanese-related sulfurtransferase
MNTTTTTTQGIPAAPSSEELAAQGFIFPELPRVTSEQLKQMMDDGGPLVLVDTRNSVIFDLGHLPQAINIPFEPEAEQIATFLTVLPKDRLIIFYCP